MTGLNIVIFEGELDGRPTFGIAALGRTTEFLDELDYLEELAHLEEHGEWMNDE